MDLAVGGKPPYAMTVGVEIRCGIPTLCTGARGTIGARLALLVSGVGRSRQYCAKGLALACNEIKEGANTGSTMRVTVREQIALSAHG